MKKDCYAKKSSNTYINSCLYNLAAEINFITILMITIMLFVAVSVVTAVTVKIKKIIGQ